MAKTKSYYIIIRGRQPGLYEHWSGVGGAAEQVEGFADAVYKGFYTLAEASEWLSELHAETIPGLAPDLVDLLERPPERPLRQDPAALLKAGKVLIYTDGGAIDNPGPGGYGVVLRYKGHRKELYGGFRHTTNNRMELLACIQGLQALKHRCAVVLYSDSKYIVHGMTKGWAERWQARGWKLANGQDVKNADLWQQLVKLCRGQDVEFRWVRGHSGNPDNERCDRLATAAAHGQDLAADVVYEAIEKGSGSLARD
jgi:ribonuclease HI